MSVQKLNPLLSGCPHHNQPAVRVDKHFLLVTDTKQE